MQSLQGSYPAWMADSVEGNSIRFSDFFICLQVALWYLSPVRVAYTVMISVCFVVMGIVGVGEEIFAICCGINSSLMGMFIFPLFVENLPIQYVDNDIISNTINIII